MKTLKLLWLVVAITSTLGACGGDDPLIPFGLGAKGEDGVGGSNGYGVVQYQPPNAGHNCQPPTEQAIRANNECLLIVSTTKGDLVVRPTDGTRAIAAAMESTLPSDGVGSTSYALVGVDDVLLGWGLYELGVLAFTAASALYVYVKREQLAGDLQNLMDVAQEVLQDPSDSSPQARELATMIEHKRVNSSDKPWDSLTSGDISEYDIERARQQAESGGCKAVKAMIALPVSVRDALSTVNAIVCLDAEQLVLRPTWIDTRTPINLNIQNIGPREVGIGGDFKRLAGLLAGQAAAIPISFDQKTPAIFYAGELSTPSSAKLAVDWIKIGDFAGFNSGYQ